MGKAQLRELERHGYYHSVPRGVSMLPMIREGKDIIEVRRLDRMAKRGELVLYVRGANDQGVLHRVIHVRDHDYVIAGDNCWRREVIPHERVVGVASSFYRNGKWYSVNDGGYRVYAWLWTALFPVRRPIYYVRDRARAKIARIRGHHA